MDVDSVPDSSSSSRERNPEDWQTDGSDGEEGEAEESSGEESGGEVISAQLEPARNRPAMTKEAVSGRPDDAEPCPIQHTATYDASNQLHKPPVVRKFGRLAGKVYGTEEIVGEEIYQNSVQGDLRNIYAPFSCKMDWEIARWAKLRGPSSTAFTDLMSIEGVSRPSSLQKVLWLTGGRHRSQVIWAYLSNPLRS